MMHVQQINPTGTPIQNQQMHQHFAAEQQNRNFGFPLISVEFKLRAPDGLVGRLIGKNGYMLQKIMDETISTICVNEKADSTQADRIITIRAGTLENALAAEKRVTHNLQQNLQHDINAGINYNYQSHSTPTPTGYAYSPVENIVPHYIANATQSAMRTENTCTTYSSFGASLPPYGSAMPIAIGGPAIYFQPTTGFSNYNLTHPQQISFAQQPQQTNTIIKSRLYVPDNMIGSLIGSKGQNIKNMMAMTGAIITIESGDNRNKRDFKSHSMAMDEKIDSNAELKDDVFEDANANAFDKLNLSKNEVGNRLPTENQHSPTAENGKFTPTENKTPEVGQQEKPENIPSTSSKPLNQVHSMVKRAHSENNADTNRSIFVSGYDFQVYKAQYMVFQKISENSRRFFEECIIPCEAIVPTKCIGRIIGKGGANVRELQMVTNAVIKIPDSASQNSAETPVKITGNYYSFQLAQSRIGAMVSDTEIKESKEYEGRRSARNSNSTFKSHASTNGKSDMISPDPPCVVTEGTQIPNL